LGQMDQTLAVESLYHSRYQDVLNQMNTENALAEQIRQFNQQLAEQQRQFNYKHKLGEFARSAKARKASSTKAADPLPTQAQLVAELAQKLGTKEAIDWVNSKNYYTQEEKNALIGNIKGVDMTEYYKNTVVG